VVCPQMSLGSSTLTEDKTPLNDTRLAAIWETAKLWSEDRCEGAYHQKGCKCLKRSSLANPAMEMVEEIRRLRKLCDDTVSSSTLVEGSDGPQVLITYAQFKQLSEVVKDADRGDDW
jgi:hypothetical protein